MNTRVARDEYGVRDGASAKHEQTAGIMHEQRPAPFCLHRVVL
ncbi:hypothetical protein [Nocardia testacea]